MSGMTQPVVQYPTLKAPSSIVNGFSAAGWAAMNFGGILNGKQIQPGVMVANTLKTVLNLAGSGVLEFLGAYCQDGTARTMRIQVIIDGVTVFDSTSAAIAAVGTGAVVVGTYLSYNTQGVPNPIPFKQSCVINMASSLSETDKFNIYEMHRMT